MQILLHLPDEIGERFKSTIPSRQRSSFVTRLLEQALPKQDEALYQLALAVEQDKALAKDMSLWDETVNDGFEVTE